MTQNAAAEPYTTRFSTDVAAIDGRAVRLETSFFYAESGGQPADRGTIGGVPVADVQQAEDGTHVHTLAADPTFREGQTVVCDIDWTFRMYCMRAHTASHVLYGVARELLDDLGYGGFGISAASDPAEESNSEEPAADEGKVRVDFETSTTVDDDVLVELERLVNLAVWESREVTWEEVSLDAVEKNEFVAFNTKTEEDVFADADTVRLVTIGEGDVTPGQPSEGPLDVAACGGTHVRNTREIGPVTVLDRSNPGEGLTRVEFAVGPRSIDRRAVEKRSALAAGRTLGTSVDDVPAGIERLQDEVSSLESELADMRTTLVESQLAALDVVERDGRTWLVGSVADVGPNDLQSVVRAAAGDRADVVALVGETDSTFVVVGAADGHDAAAVVSSVTDEHGGGGGGSDRFAQGGGIGSAPAAVVADLRGQGE
ncbi:DHHA1 domain-containing protein [Haloarchaeobius sp. HME9146]|uniref:alanine--tRNA ligase-related protein n=1 Tax=Haloarchaeobius sp. HME9146 TaxID=2978732 RepID=UPI0021BE42E8|nr:DHHA1 domain-containing protein [Haloarchaeobius sp. HME9146]MCT9097119.1 DHHA1 domain-containing protein [Haloarchaeobius sp. HME9146]